MLSKPRIVCAANRDTSGLIVCGARHYDSIMRKQIERLAEPWNKVGAEQGFIDQHCNFHTRTEAWKIAMNNNQITRRCGGDTSDGGTLYSENLY